MATKVTVIGMGGFGKWTVTLFKDRLVEIFGEKNIPDIYRWISFDLSGEEYPPIHTLRFKNGRSEKFSLDFENTSREFHRFSGDYQPQIQRIQENKNPNELIKQFLDDSDAEKYVIDSTQRHVPAGERRHTSRVSFFLEAQDIHKKLDKVIQDEGIIFVVSSLAGGTGSGTFLDILYLVNHLLNRKNFSSRIITILSLPQSFEGSKPNEDLNPLKANCFASFREFRWLDYLETKTRVSYNSTQSELKNIEKAYQTISALTFFIDGHKVAGENGSEIYHFMGVVPATVDFIDDFSLTATKSEDGKDGDSGESLTPLANWVNRTATNRKMAVRKPDLSGIYSSFGGYRIIFDGKSIMTHFAQKISLDILGHFLAPDPDAGNRALKNYRDFLLSKATKFDRTIVASLKDGLSQENLLSRDSMVASLQEDVEFPTFHFTGNIDQKTKSPGLKKAIDDYEKRILGKDTDNYPAKETFYSVLNHYEKHYVTLFADRLRNELHGILTRQKGTDNYGLGVFDSCLNFLEKLKTQYGKAKDNFIEARKRYSENSLSPERMDEDVHAAYEAVEKAKIGTRTKSNKEYLQKRIKKNKIVVEAMLQGAVLRILEKNILSIEEVEPQVRRWKFTFEQGKNKLSWAMSELGEVRNSRITSFKTHYHLTGPDDQHEREMYDLIRYSESRQKAIDYEGSDQGENRKKEFAQLLPQTNWADLVSGFNWEFRVTDSGRRNLVCTLPRGVPDFPADWSDKQDESGKVIPNDSVLTWNYKFTENYLTSSDLGKINDISILDLLAWMGWECRSIFSELEERSVSLLKYNDGLDNTISDPRCREHLREDQVTIIVPSRTLTSTGQALKEKIKNAVPHKKFMYVEGSKNGQVSCLRLSHYLLAQPMTSLWETMDVYRDKIEKNDPPPLHVWPGPRNAARMEVLISLRFKVDRPDLHPKMVSALENQVILKNLVFADLFGMIKREHKVKDGQGLYWWEIDDFKLPEGMVASALELQFPAEKTEETRQFCQKLGKEIDARLNKSHAKDEVASYLATIAEKIAEHEDSLDRQKDPLLRDSLMVSIIFLEQEAEELRSRS